MNDSTKHHNELSFQAKKTMISRIVVGLVLVLVLFPLIFIGDYLFFAGILVLMGIGEFEIINTIKPKNHKYSLISYIVNYLVLYLPFILIFVESNLIEGYPWYDLVHGFSFINLGIYYLGFLILSYTLLVLFDKTFKINDAISMFFFNIFFILSFSSLCYLRYLPLSESINNLNIYDSSISLKTRFLDSTTLFFYFAMGICFSDIFAYFFGVLFGKHKMCPNISPKKTWEGFIGGVLSSFILSSAFALILAYFDKPILNMLDLNHWYLILIISALMPLIAVIGDLLFSLIKRHYEIKDFGTILKSHGGILDRLDSITFSGIIVSMLIHIFYLF